MSQTIYGAVIQVKLDVGLVPFMLDRDDLDDVASVLNDSGAEMTDITNPVLSLNVQWGATDPRGILTDVEAGRTMISVYDEDRDYDPANAAKSAILVEGALGRVLVDGNAAFTGYIDTVEHTLADSVTTFVLQDAIPRLSGMAVVTTLASGSTGTQLAQVFDVIDWPNASGMPEGYYILGTPAAFRDEDPVVDSAWAVLNRIRDAELADMWVDHWGRVAFRMRGDDEVSSNVPDIGDAPGIPLADILTANRRTTIVNHVAVDMTDPEPDREWSTTTGNRRTFAASQEDLLLIEPV